MADISGEFETVQDVYDKAFKILSQDPSEYKCQVKISPNFDDDDINPNQNTYIGLIVTFSFPKHLNYPSNPPHISFKPTKEMKKTLQSFYHTFKENTDMLQLTKKQAQSLDNHLKKFYDENNDDEMLFELINQIQEWINDNNHPPTNDNHLNKNDEKDANQDEEKKKQSDNDKVSKILMLHAFKQNPKIFRTRSKNFVKLLSNKYELVYAQGPIKLNGTSSCPNPYCWYQYPKVTDNDNENSNDDDGAQTNLANLLKNYKECEYIGLLELIKYFYKFLVEQCLENNSKIIGIISFSQGSTLAAMLCWLATLNDDEFEEKVILPNLDIMNKIGLYGLFKKYGQVFNQCLKIKACVLMSGHLYPLPKQLPDYQQFVMDCKKGDDNDKVNRLKCKSLHTMSDKDEWVTMEKTKDLLPMFEHTETIIHKNGHAVYNNKFVYEWIIKHL